MTIRKVYTSQILTIIILHYSYLAINTNQTSPLLYYITMIFMISCPCIIQIHTIAYYIILIMSFTLINRLHNAAIPIVPLKHMTVWRHFLFWKCDILRMAAHFSPSCLGLMGKLWNSVDLVFQILFQFFLDRWVTGSLT